MKRFIFFITAGLFSISVLADTSDLSLEELHRLENLENIVVITKRYLSKTGRLSTGFSSGASLNNPLFVDLGLNLDISYYLSERISLMFNYLQYEDFERNLNERLRDRALKGSQNFTFKRFYGAHVRFFPSYGKMSVLNQNIISFDYYFDLGYGVNTGDVADESVDSRGLSFGFGQEVPLGPNSSFFWRFNVRRASYEWKSRSNNVDDMSLFAGLSLYWGGAK